MPAWIISILKWGGIALAVIGIVAWVSVQWILTGPTEAGAEAASITAPVTLYFVLVIVGVVAAIVGFALGWGKT